MSLEVSEAKFLAWKCMDLAGILRGKKRRLFIEELEKRTNDDTSNTDHSERILRTAQRMYPEDKKMRRKYIRTRLKEWEKTACRYES
ncbi:MAG: hypothetical protein HY505_00065 [Candidatus Yanofskybacteria bacterium]|nr:hypothetical protein [Candidatus Yanofskybacteria bacterium]